jgi:hypothetical protein
LLRCRRRLHGGRAAGVEWLQRVFGRWQQAAGEERKDREEGKLGEDAYETKGSASVDDNQRCGEDIGREGCMHEGC